MFNEGNSVKTLNRKIKIHESYHGLDIEYSINASGYGVWTQIFDDKIIVSSFDSASKGIARKKAINFCKQHLKSVVKI